MTGLGSPLERDAHRTRPQQRPRLCEGGSCPSGTGFPGLAWSHSQEFALWKSHGVLPSNPTCGQPLDIAKIPPDRHKTANR